METEYDNNVLEYRKLSHGKYNVKWKKDDDLEDNIHVKNTLPNHLGIFCQ